MLPLVSIKKPVAALSMCITFPYKAEPPDADHVYFGAELIPEIFAHDSPLSTVFNTSPLLAVNIAVRELPLDTPNNEFVDEVAIFAALTCVQLTLRTLSTQLAINALFPVSTKRVESNIAMPKIFVDDE